MSKRLFITTRQKEQAERMAAKWEARAEAFYSNDEGWGYTTKNFCKTVEDADKAESYAKCIYQAITNLQNGVGVWADVQVIQTAVSQRDALDNGLNLIQENIKFKGR
ncbi:hypothetical protein ACFQZE_07200 [Paenibacillus sp. GCM10027627]|uniref:hypothetical protein n=1 Tax=unclassified Paenibacillus TaxID=185978 RepID=UPI00363C10FE